MSGNAPSPWSWSDEYRTIDGRPTWSLVAAYGYGILSCDGEENSPQGINEPAIARLIAAAPMLLAELENIANADPAKWDAEVRDQFREWAQNRARAAIAAATGETK